MKESSSSGSYDYEYEEDEESEPTTGKGAEKHEKEAKATKPGVKAVAAKSGAKSHPDAATKSAAKLHAVLGFYEAQAALLRTSLD